MQKRERPLCMVAVLGLSFIILCGAIGPGAFVVACISGIIWGVWGSGSDDE